MKKLTNILALVVVILGFFAVLNAYAQECISVDYEGSKAYFGHLAETDPDEDNALTNMWSTNNLSGLSGGAMLAAPDLFCGNEALQSSTRVPENMKKGLITMADEGMATLFTSTPTVNVYAHLAEEWVPGYDKTNSGIYAAQQSGYEELMDSGIVSIWANMRNIAYVFFILVMLVAGFMIMFRHKIGGQTLVTLGNALPNVIVSLILVTFSFAIAGIIIDLGGVLMVVIQDILGLSDYVSTHNLWSLMSVFFHGTGRVLGFATGGGVALTATILGIVGVLGAGASNPVGWFILGGAGIITLLIILLIVGVVFVGSVMVLITLIKAYVGILLNVILAPLQLAVGAIPGNQEMIKNWFNNLLRNVMVFPVVFFLINLPLAIADTSNLNLGFPEKLVYVDSISDANGMDGLAALFVFLLQIAIFFYAAQVPKYLEAVFPPATPKPIQEGMAAAKGGLSKIPLIGGLFK